MTNTLPQGAQPELEPESRLSSKLTGFKNRLLKPSVKPQLGLDESYSGASGATPSFGPGSKPSPLDSAYDFGALAADSRDAGAAAATASRSSTGESSPQVCIVNLSYGRACMLDCSPQFAKQLSCTLDLHPGRKHTQQAACASSMRISLDCCLVSTHCTSYLYLLPGSKLPGTCCFVYGTPHPCSAWQQPAGQLEITNWQRHSLELNARL